MGAVKEYFLGAFEIVGDYLTDNNAHYARTIVEYAGIGITDPYTEDELGLAYRVGVELLSEVTRAKQEGITPNFVAVMNYLQDYSATIGANPPKVSE
jgi:hypothetical protein